MADKGRVYLVGAGCGEADLMTLRGRRLIESCEVLIYDDLIAPELLSLAPERAEKIYMGKRSGNHSASQSEINAMIVRKAMENRTVVRLKGGDPFVFGRGGEEIEALKENGIEYEEVPGISSAIAIPAAAGIPVTHRGLSRSFHVITAHTSDTPDGLPEYMETLAKLPGTLVFLMGLSKLELISRRLIEGGMDPQTPAAVISGGNSPNPAAVRASLADIPARTRAAGVLSPAVIVVGRTAALDFSSTVRLPLAGKKIALTGTDAIAGKLNDRLSALGAQVYQAQRSVIRELDGFDMNTLTRKPGTVVFTSGNGVKTFFRRLNEQGVDIRALYGCRFAVIGSASGKVLSSYGIHADLCPESFTTEALAQLLLSTHADGDRVYLYRSAMGSQELREKLEARLDVTDIRAYTVVSDESVSENAHAMLPGTDCICFSSAGGVEEFFRIHKAVPDGARCVCIGEVTAKALRERYPLPFICSGEISAESMVEAIMKI